MKEALCSWMESLVCYFLLFSVVRNVLPDNHCKKYIQYYMGLLLILLILSPVFRVTGIQEAVDEYLSGWEEQEDQSRIWEEKAENWETQFYEEQKILQGQEVLP